MSLDWIKKNVKVYSQELDLKTAQRIPGLRAVFGESYPDPVRVVTLEHDLDMIVQDIDNQKWRGTSVELCGGTYGLHFIAQGRLTLTTFATDTSSVMWPIPVTSRVLSLQRNLELLKVSGVLLLSPELKRKK